jgi:UDP-N-acetyl-D-galactosamine dehydrogenase
MSIYKKIVNKEAKIAVIGLGYVGLPIALAFAKKVKVIGFDINEDRVTLMKKGIDPSKELEKKDFAKSDITFTHKLEELKEANFFIVAVPTPINEHNLPDLRPLIGASTTVGKVLKKGDYVVYQNQRLLYYYLVSKQLSYRILLIMALILALDLKL